MSGAAGDASDQAAAVRIVAATSEQWPRLGHVFGPRARGIGVAPLHAAVAWVAKHGASVFDGHPVDIRSFTGTPAPSAIFTGTLSDGLPPAVKS